MMITDKYNIENSYKKRSNLSKESLFTLYSLYTCGLYMYIHIQKNHKYFVLLRMCAGLDVCQ